MSKTSSRRAFLKGGALAAAPLTVAAAPALAGTGELERLRDQAALAELHRSWLRDLAGGSAPFEGVASLVPDHAAEPDLIELAADGLTATGRFHMAAEIVERLPTDWTFAQMAHAQGGGTARRTERRVLSAQYRKAEGGWRIARVELTPA